MKVHRDLGHLPKFKNAVITSGTFDGVHKGHLKIIDQVKREANLLNGESVLVTFDPHPRLVLPNSRPEKLKLLSTFDEKVELLAEQNIDHLVVVPFTQEFSNMEPDDYIAGFLIKKLHAKCIITGYDHHFGKNRKGDYRLLEEFSKKFNYIVKEIPEYILEEVTISSTRIRNSLLSGDIETANEFLGYDYFIEGKVIHGNKLGRELGYPTANIKVENEHKLIPKYGIYAIGISKVEAENKQEIFPGMMSIGIRPTLSDNVEMIEANIFDFDGDLYGKPLRIHFKKYIRPEMKFENLDLLTSKIREDEEVVRTFWQQQNIGKM